MVISQHSVFLEMGMGRPSNYRSFAKPQKSYSKEQGEGGLLFTLLFAIQSLLVAEFQWPPLFH